MKYIYCDSKFVSEDKLKSIQQNMSFYVDIPVLSFPEKSEVKVGMIDLCSAKEYIMPIQLDNIIIKSMSIFREDVSFIPEHKYGSIFVSANLRILLPKDNSFPTSYIWDDIVFDYIRLENLEYFLNVIIPFINWGIQKTHKGKDYIFLFAILLCKKELLDNNYDKVKCPYMSNCFLNDITVKQRFYFQTRTGRDDYSYEFTRLIYETKQKEEFYYLKLVGNKLDEFGNCTVRNKNGYLIDIEYCTNFDSNAYGWKPEYEYSEEECNCYKNTLIRKHEELYKYFFEEFKSLFERFLKYKNRKKYTEEQYECEISNLKESNDILYAKISLYEKALESHNIPIPEFDKKKYLDKRKSDNK